MFGGKKPNYMKLRTNLRLCINRLKLLEKKKTELALKARMEIAEYLKLAKDDRARIRVEHIVREDYLVEAMEIIEMFCDLMLARFGLIEKMKDMDPGLEEPIATVIWASPRLFSDIPELREVANQLTIKYGKEYSEACRTNALEKTNEQVLHKMALISPPKKLIESYLVEIAKTYNVPFEPDPTAMEDPTPTSNLIDIGFESVDPGWSDKGKRGGPGGGGGGGGGGGSLQPLSPDHLNTHPVNPGSYPGSYGPQFGPPGMPPPPAGFHQQVQPSGPPFFPAGVPPPGSSLPGADAGRPPPPLPSVGPVAGSLSGGVPSPYSNEKSELGFDQNQNPSNSFAGYPSESTYPNQSNGGVPTPPHYDDVFGPPALSNQPPGPSPHVPTTDEPSASFPPAGPVSSRPTPAPRQNLPPGVPTMPTMPPAGGVPVLPVLPSIPNDLPGLPSVPGDSLSSNTTGGEDINFDDLTRRFEELKKKK